ncbi:hypothetical protein ABVV53_13580 [Novosphingobium sp. RD2P27]|uniref:Uncharacterized protein n=1 Tax=Novosphingobium kalidii TaxID=3230299 RepID=A0ABV2D4B7_9SPHN
MTHHWTEEAGEIANLARAADAIEVAGCREIEGAVERCDGIGRKCDYAGGGRRHRRVARACSSSHRFAAAGPSCSILRRYSALLRENAACRSVCETCRDDVVCLGALVCLSPGLSVTMSCW